MVDQSFASQWTRYRQLQQMFYLFWFLWLPVGYFAMRIINTEESPNLVYVACIPYGIIFLLLDYKRKNILCPRCGLKFFRAKKSSQATPFFTKACVHCGLPKYGLEA